MVRFFLALICVAFCSYGIAQDTLTKDRKVIFEIVFQDFFNNDTISLKANDCSTFKNIILTSDKSTGMTDVKFKVYAHGRKEAEIVLKDHLIIYNYSVDQISLIIYLNGNEIKYNINLKKGAYLGFSKKNKDGLSFLQSIAPFQYD